MNNLYVDHGFLSQPISDCESVDSIVSNKRQVKMSKSCTGFFNKLTSEKPLNIFIDTKKKDKASHKVIR